MTWIKDEIQLRLNAEPFSPFRIKLVHGDCHDVANPALVAELSGGIFIGLYITEWATFPYSSVVALESLLEEPT